MGIISVKTSEDIYNPFSLFNAFAQKKYANFWFSTGTPTFLIDILASKAISIFVNWMALPATAEQFDAPTNSHYRPSSGTLPKRLSHYQRSMIRDFQTVYIWLIPTKKLGKALSNHLMPAYVHLPARENTFYVVSFIKDLRIGKLNECLERLKSFFASIPNNTEQ